MNINALLFKGNKMNTFIIKGCIKLIRNDSKEIYVVTKSSFKSIQFFYFMLLKHS